MLNRLTKSVITLLIVFVSTASFAADFDFPHIETVGVGEVVATPDMAEFSVQVVEQRIKAQQAKAAVDHVIIAFHSRLQELGVTRSDVRSGNIQLSPQYSYPKNEKPKLEGYRATRTVTVIVRQLDQLNTLLDGALGDGINRINHVALKVSNEKKYQQKAQLAAIEDAKMKAKVLAAGFDKRVEGVWQVIYRNEYNAPVEMRAVMLDSAKIQASYQDSEIIIKDRLDVVFRLND
ncbi:MAG: oxidative stress defense protein [Aliivibrio sp.]|uniref:oxidative stress defense protein n=1 Tax=Aliivibrio sp. TaxID=1872443 RepID=UPI001A50027E|nr:oxidative stress defense protein [Aliivibrio sp.]